MLMGRIREKRVKINKKKEELHPTKIKLINYLANIIPNLSSMAENLRDAGNKRQKKVKSFSSERKRGKLLIRKQPLVKKHSRDS